jgi:hypothetical protein
MKMKLALNCVISRKTPTDTRTIYRCETVLGTTNCRSLLIQVFMAACVYKLHKLSVVEMNFWRWSATVWRKKKRISNHVITEKEWVYKILFYVIQKQNHIIWTHPRDGRHSLLRWPITIVSCFLCPFTRYWLVTKSAMQLWPFSDLLCSP